MTDNGAAIIAAETCQGLEELGILHETTLAESLCRAARYVLLPHPSAPGPPPEGVEQHIIGLYSARRNAINSGCLYQDFRFAWSSWIAHASNARALVSRSISA